MFTPFCALLLLLFFIVAIFVAYKKPCVSSLIFSQLVLVVKMARSVYFYFCLSFSNTTLKATSAFKTFNKMGGLGVFLATLLFICCYSAAPVLAAEIDLLALVLDGLNHWAILLDTNDEPLLLSDADARALVSNSGGTIYLENLLDNMQTGDTSKMIFCDRPWVVPGETEPSNAQYLIRLVRKDS